MSRRSHFSLLYFGIENDQKQSLRHFDEKNIVKIMLNPHCNFNTPFTLDKERF